MWGKITLGVAAVGAGLFAHAVTKRMAYYLIERGNQFLADKEIQEIDVDGKSVTALVIEVPERVQTMLPIMAPRNRPSLRPYIRAINSLYFANQIDEGGVYAVEVLHDRRIPRTGDFVLYSLFPIKIEKGENAGEVRTEELVEKPQS